MHFKNLALLGTLASLAVPAVSHASVARQVVFNGMPYFTNMGAGSAGNTVTTSPVVGSLWFDDNYNIVYNPAYVNTFKNYVIYEKAQEGGFFHQITNTPVTVGTYGGRGSLSGAQANYGGNLVSPGVRSRTGMVGTATSSQTPAYIEPYIGLDLGEVKLGAHMAWGRTRNSNSAVATIDSGAQLVAHYTHFDLGATAYGFEPFIGGTLWSGYSNTLPGEMSNQDLGEFDIGLRYKWGNMTFYGVYHKYIETGVSPGVLSGVNSDMFINQKTTRMNMTGLGVAYKTTVNTPVGKTHIYSTLGWWMNGVLDDTSTTVLGQDYRDQILVFASALEVDMTSWFTLFMGSTVMPYNDRISKNNSTNVTNNVTGTARTFNPVFDATTPLSGRFGASFHLSGFDIDVALGNVISSGGVYGTITTDDRSLNLTTLAQVSASYHW